MLTADRTALFHEGRMALGLPAVDMAPIMGMSPRTASRWSAGRAIPGPEALARLAQAVLAKDEALARRIYAVARADADAAGVAIPALAGTEAAGGDPHAADTVLCAAADAIGLPPRAVRPCMLAGLRRARDVGLGMEALIAALDAAEAGPVKKGSKTRERG